MKLNLTYDLEAWANIIQQVVARNPHQGPCQYVYLTITRGSDSSRSYYHPSLDLPATCYACSVPFTPPSNIANGRLVSHLDIRWGLCHIKANGLTANVILRNFARDHQADESLLHRDGWITECASSNVFLVMQGKVYTTPTSHNILPGVTRAAVIDYCKAARFPVIEAPIQWSQAKYADEIWITSSCVKFKPLLKWTATLLAMAKRAQCGTQSISTINNRCKQYAGPTINIKALGQVDYYNLPGDAGIYPNTR